MTEDDIYQRKAREIIYKLNLEMKDEMGYEPARYVDPSHLISIHVKNINILDGLRWHKEAKPHIISESGFTARSTFKLDLLLKLISFLEGLPINEVTIKMGNNFPIVIEAGLLDLGLAPYVTPKDEDEGQKIVESTKAKILAESKPKRDAKGRFRK